MNGVYLHFLKLKPKQTAHVQNLLFSFVIYLF